MKKCYKCKDNAIEGKSFCEKHAQVKRDEQAKRRAIWTEKGLCTTCGGDKGEGETRVMCNGCRKQQKTNRLKRIAKRKANNCCTTCGDSHDDIFAWHHAFCPGCHLKLKFGWTGTKKQAMQLINNKLDTQNIECALTGRCLINNKYHIDHIIPRSTDPSIASDPDNWQLIVEGANYFKQNQTEEEVLNISIDIVKKAIRDGKIKISNISQSFGV